MHVMMYVYKSNCKLDSKLQGATSGMQIDPELMPDSLHPNAKGMDLYLDCLDQHLKPYLPVKRGLDVATSRPIGVPH